MSSSLFSMKVSPDSENLDESLENSRSELGFLRAWAVQIPNPITASIVWWTTVLHTLLEVFWVAITFANSLEFIRTWKSIQIQVMR